MASVFGLGSFHLPESKAVPAHIIEAEELVVNWHLTAACNFRCRYCFASWDGGGPGCEVWRDATETGRLLASLRHLFDPANPTTSLRERLRWRAVRLSLAGGEPTLLGDRLPEIAAQARELGFRVSLITNGSRPAVVAKMAPHLDILGISMDTADAATARLIGRTSSGGDGVSPGDTEALLLATRATHPGLVVKLNTVVSSANVDEDLSGLVQRLRPDRWKVMRMLPVLTGELAVDAAAFRSFVHRHRAFSSMMTVEDNRDMETTYVMVDPHGRFFQNGDGMPGYSYSRSILEVGATAAFAEMAFRSDGFASRYAATGVDGGGR